MNTTIVSSNPITTNNISVYSGLINDTNNTSDFRNVISDMVSSNNGLADKQTLDIKIAADEKVKNAIFNAVTILNLMGNINQIATTPLANLNKDVLVNTIVAGYGFDASQKMLFLQGLKGTAIELATSQANAGIETGISAKTATPAIFGTREKISIPVTAQLSNENANSPAVTPIPATSEKEIFTMAEVMEAKNTPISETENVKPQGLPQTVLNNSENIIILSAAVKPAENTVLIKNQIVEGAFQPTTITNKITEIATAPIELTGSPEIIGKVPVLVSAVKQAVAQLTGLVKNLVVGIAQTEKSAQGSVVNTNTGIINKNVSLVAGNIEKIETGKITTSADIATVTIKNADPVILEKNQTLLAEVVVSTQRLSISGLPPATVSQNENNGTPVIKVNVKDSGINKINVDIQDAGTGMKYSVVPGKNEEVLALINKINSLLTELNGTIETAKTTQFVKISSVVGGVEIPTTPITIPQTILENKTAVANTLEMTKSLPVNNVENNTQAVLVETPAKETIIPQKDTQVLATAKVINPTLKQNIALTTPEALYNIETLNPESDKFTTLTTKTVFSGAEQLKSSLENKLIDGADWVAKNVIMTTGFTQALKDSFTAMGSAVINAANLAKTVKEEVVLNQVVDGIGNNITYLNKTEVKMILRPENLGPVIIKIEQKDKLISATIQASTVEVKDILKANIVDLKNTLGNMGIKLDSVEVSMISQNIGSGLQDAPKQAFREWEGGSFRGNTAQITETTGDYVNKDGYLNYLA